MHDISFKNVILKETNITQKSGNLPLDFDLQIIILSNNYYCVGVKYEQLEVGRTKLHKCFT